VKWVDLERELPCLFAFAKASGLPDQTAAGRLEAYLVSLTADHRLGRVRDRITIFAGLARRITENLENPAAPWSEAPIGAVATRYAALPQDLRMALFLMIEADFNLLQTAEIVAVEASDLATRLEQAISNLDLIAA
jgi:hypothetical protein